jgi:hypothetical protein
LFATKPNVLRPYSSVAVIFVFVFLIFFSFFPFPFLFFQWASRQRRELTQRLRAEISERQIAQGLPGVVLEEDVQNLLRRHIIADFYRDLQRKNMRIVFDTMAEVSSKNTHTHTHAHTHRTLTHTTHRYALVQYMHSLIRTVLKRVQCS